MRTPWWFPFGQVPLIKPRDLANDLKNGANKMLLDVREPIEYAQGHIKGAVNIPVRELPNRLEELGQNKMRPVVAICLSGHRSIPAFRLLKRAGFDNAYSLEGGLLNWRQAKLPLSRRSE